MLRCVIPCLKQGTGCIVNFKSNDVFTMNNEKKPDGDIKYKTDEELLAALKRKDSLAEEQLFRTRMGILYATAYKIVADKEDARSCARLAFSKTLMSGEDFTSMKHVINYMCKCVKRACFDHLKKLKAQKAIPPYNVMPIDELEEIIVDERLHDEELTRQELMRKVLNEIEHLPPPDREMLKLFLEGRKTAEIADLLNCTPRQVREKLRKLPTTIYKALIEKNLILALLFLYFI
jgi:RNA polymerase sigma factor (sigma-70 family)